MDCKNGRKDKKSCQKADLCHVLKVLSLELPLAIFTLFGSEVNVLGHVSKVSGFRCDPKESTSVVDHLINDPFFYFSKEMKYRKIPKISPGMNKPLQI